MKYTNVITELKKYKSPAKAKFALRFFRTGKGEYGEGDIFWGLTVPEQRIVAKKFKYLPLAETLKLLKSKIHEHRLTALIILVEQFKKAGSKTQKQIFEAYIKNLKYVNNWDLVDASARDIVGGYLFNRNRNLLYKLAQSKHLWSRRVAIVATHYFINQKDFKDTYKISEMLLSDRHDLIHKASGWMLRESGKVSRKDLERFLSKHCKKMPRTMLRYSLEHFSKAQRTKYM